MPRGQRWLLLGATTVFKSECVGVEEQRSWPEWRQQGCWLWNERQLNTEALLPLPRGTFHTSANISHYHNDANSDRLLRVYACVCVCVTPGSHYIVQKSLSVATHFHFPGCHCPGESKHNGQKPSAHKASLRGRLQHQSRPSSSSFLLFAPCSTSSSSPQFPALLPAVDNTDRGFQAITLTGAFY